MSDFDDDYYDDDSSPLAVDLNREELDNLLNDIKENNVIKMMCDELKTLNYDTGLPNGIDTNVSSYIFRMRQLIYPSTFRQWNTEQNFDVLDTNGYFSQSTVFLALTGYDNIALRESIAIHNALNGHESNIYIVFDVNHFYAMFDCRDSLMQTAYQNVFGDCENDAKHEEIYKTFPGVKIPSVRHGGDCGPQSMIYAMMVEKEYRRLQELAVSASASAPEPAPAPEPAHEPAPAPAPAARRSSVFNIFSSRISAPAPVSTARTSSPAPVQEPSLSLSESLPINEGKGKKSRKSRKSRKTRKSRKSRKSRK
jgi:hypothetical protein